VCAGLAGLVLGASDTASGAPGIGTEGEGPGLVVLTDGHSRSVAALAKSVALHRVVEGFQCEVASGQLVWSECFDPELSVGEHLLQGRAACAFGADIAFFEDFHTALIHTAAWLLHPPHEGSAVAAAAIDVIDRVTQSDRVFAELVSRPGSLVILAPSRGGSLERLVERLVADGRWTVTLAPHFAEWLHATVMGSAGDIEGEGDEACGPLQLLTAQLCARGKAHEVAVGDERAD
jgi:hypothetical protein